MTLRLRGEKGAAVEILSDGKPAGLLRLDETLDAMTEKEVPLVNDPGEHEITLRMTGKIAIDSFRLTD